MYYICQRYPENSLFALRELVPIEDLERLPVKVIAFLCGHLSEVKRFSFLSICMELGAR